MSAPEENPADDVRPASANGDRMIWREVAGDYYSPSIHITPSGGIGINVGGLVHVRTPAEWHALASLESVEPAHERIVTEEEHLS